MSKAPTAPAQRIMSLSVGKACVVSTADVLKTVRKHMPEAKFKRLQMDGHYLITRLA